MGKGSSNNRSSLKIKAKAPSLENYLGKTLKARAKAMEQRAEELKVQAEILAKTGVPDLNRTFFTVSIRDVWDADREVSHRGSGSTTARGLKNAVEQAEREYLRRSGDSKVRDDGVLDYSVTVHLGDSDISLPEKFWYRYTTSGKRWGNNPSPSQT